MPLRSWSRIRNHGDQISADIVRLMFQAEPVQVSAGEPHVLAVGSITFMANALSTLWGCGVLNRQVGLADLAPGQLRALRGRHSADVLVGRGIRVPDIPLGDPGIFAADLLRRRGLAPRRRARVVVVPHHGSLRHPAYAEMATADDVAVVETLDNDWGLLQDIAGAEIVVSESLRGLIYAESFGRPSVWISSTEDPNWTFKFHDWFSTTHNPQLRPRPVGSDVEALARAAEFRFSRIDKAELLSAFPHDRMTEARPRLVPYDRCRRLSPMTVFGDDSLAGPLRQLASGGAGDTAARITAFDEIRARVAQIFDQWAERPYVCVVDRRAAVLPTEAQKRIIADELDRRVDMDFAVIVHKGHTVSPLGEDVVLYPSVSFYPDGKTMDGCLMLRPSLDEFGPDYGVFGIADR